MKKDLLIHSDVYAGLNSLDDDSIAVAITSPPYWKQRDYNFDGQIGQEKTPEEYIGKLIAIFRKLRQKLSPDGVFFLNIGDKYLNRYGKSHLLQIPYRLAYHMVEDGWYLKDIIIWYKTNHMPSSVKDRLSNTYEPILVFSKNKENIYKNSDENVVKIPLQQTRWKHTAVYPELLVEKMLNRVNLKNGDLILDPFAGTGTTGEIVKKMRNTLYHTDIYSILIEKGNKFIEIIKRRIGVSNIIELSDKVYSWKPIDDDDIQIPEDIEPITIINCKYGEVYIAKDSREFLSILKGVMLDDFMNFHREDALYFIGVKKWNIGSLYYVHNIHKYGYVLRNMIVVLDGSSWFPIFMLAKDSTKVAYRFYIDRVRINPKTEEKRKWKDEDFLGIKVIDTSGKETIRGYLLDILKRYDDNFPEIVLVRYNGNISVEFVIHPDEDEFLMEGLKFYCPVCNVELTEPYDPIGENFCPSCGTRLWEDIESIPIVKEPLKIIKSFSAIEWKKYAAEKTVTENKFQRERVISGSKFSSFDRINWGASPGARKLMMGEYFTKTRLYRISQPLVAQYLAILRKHNNMSIKQIIDKFPRKYHHTVGHWFRKDFGGSIPIPQDIRMLQDIMGIDDNFIDILSRTALKFQTVKTSAKGKNPGDYIENKDESELVNLLRSLYIPSYEYIKMILQKNNSHYISDSKNELNFDREKLIPIK